jgi:hypothetical protein
VIDLTVGEKPHVGVRGPEAKYIVNDFVYCKPGVFDRLEGFEELEQEGIITEYHAIRPRGMKISGVSSSSDRIAGFTVMADSLEEFNRKHRMIVEKCKVLDMDGNDMPTDLFHLDLCLATGNITKEYASEHLVQIASYVNTHSPWNTEIQQIHVKNYKHIELIPLTGDHVIVIGEPRDIEDKLNRLTIFYKEGLDKAGWNKYSIIDLNYADQVVCTKKNIK